VEADLSAGKFDGRLQLNSGATVNPQSFTEFPSYVQATAGAGYSIRQGFRIGVSGFRGPYLGPVAAPFLPAGNGIRNFPASGLGADVQWVRGRWSVGGELQRFWFDSPNFKVVPSIFTGYAEAKAVITPRLYVSTRAGWLTTGRVADTSGVTASSFAPWQQSYEFAGGWWLGRRELLKASYEWLKIEGRFGTKSNVLGMQFVYSLPALSASFR